MNKKGQAEGIGIVVGAVLVGIIFYLFISISIVQYNEFGIRKHFTGNIDNDVYKGLNYIGAFSSMIKVSNQIRNYEIMVDAPSKDYQSVKIDLNMNIRIKEDKTYDFVKNYPNEQMYIEYLNNKVQEKVKTILLEYNAEEILNNRLEISKKFYDSAKEIKELEYFELNDLAIKNIAFSPEFTLVLEKKAQIGIQNQIIQSQKQNLILLKENINVVDINDYFKYELIEKWDGKTPLIISDSLLSTTLVK